MNFLKEKFRKIIIFVSRNKYIYKLSRRLAYDHDGENNCDLKTNGEMKVLEKFIKDNSIVFDVGANIGEWTELVLKINNSIKVHSFEPCNSTFLELEKNIKNKNVKLNKVGLDISIGEKKFYVFGDCSVLNSLHNRTCSNVSGCTEQKITTNTVDNYCAENNITKIDFLKIDVEGNDFNVLKGAKEMLKNNLIDVVQFEYGGTYIDAGFFLKDYFNFIKENNLDYSIYKILPHKIAKVFKYENKLENFQYANYLLVKNGVKIYDNNKIKRRFR